MLIEVLMIGAMGTFAFADEDYEQNGVRTVNVDLKGNALSRSLETWQGINPTQGTTIEITSIELIDPETLEPLDPSIATVSFTNYKSAQYVKITFNKEGKIYEKENTIVHWPNGVDRESSIYFAYDAKAITYTSPIKALKLGKINLTKKLKHSRAFTGKAFKAKVTFKQNKGWKFIEMYKYKVSDPMGAKTYLKKGKTIKLKKGERLAIKFRKGQKTTIVTYTAE